MQQLQIKKRSKTTFIPQFSNSQYHPLNCYRTLFRCNEGSGLNLNYSNILEEYRTRSRCYQEILENLETPDNCFLSPLRNMINHSGILVGRNECTAVQYHTSAYRLRAAIGEWVFIYQNTSLNFFLFLALCPEPCNSIRFKSNKLVYPAFSITPCDHMGGNVVLVYQENVQVSS